MRPCLMESSIVRCALTMQTLPWPLQVEVHFKIHSKSHVYAVQWERKGREYAYLGEEVAPLI